MELKSILYEKEAGVGLVTLNRPKAFNAIDDELIAELSAVIDAIGADDEVRAVIITGGGQSLCRRRRYTFYGKGGYPTGREVRGGGQKLPG